MAAYFDKAAAEQRVREIGAEVKDIRKARESGFARVKELDAEKASIMRLLNAASPRTRKKVAPVVPASVPPKPEMPQ